MTFIIRKQTMTFDPATVLITGANCGIGLELDAQEAGAKKVLVDDMTQQVEHVKQGQSAEPGLCLQARG